LGRTTLAWFVLRWQLDVTFREVRTHLGVETGAAVVWARDRPYHPGAVEPLLPGHAAGAWYWFVLGGCQYHICSRSRM